MHPSATRTAALLALLALGLLGGGCAVRFQYVRPDFARVDAHSLKRVVVVATPLSGAPPRAAALLARMAARYVQQHKDYLVMDDTTIPTAGAWKQACGQEIHGVVRVMMARILQEGDDLTLDMSADLRRCKDGVVVWSVAIRDTNEMGDEDLTQLARVYEREFGAAARRYAGPFFIAVQTAFESLPSPVLTDEETLEKISME